MNATKLNRKSWIRHESIATLSLASIRMHSAYCCGLSDLSTLSLSYYRFSSLDSGKEILLYGNWCIRAFFFRLVLIADQWHLNNTILQSKRELWCLRSIVHSKNRNQLLELFSHACINFNSMIFNNKQCDINFMCAISRLLSQCVEQRKDAKGEINRNYLLIVVGNCVSDSDLKFI